MAVADIEAETVVLKVLVTVADAETVAVADVVIETVRLSVAVLDEEDVSVVDELQEAV